MLQGSASDSITSFSGQGLSLEEETARHDRPRPSPALDAQPTQPCFRPQGKQHAFWVEHYTFQNIKAPAQVQGLGLQVAERKCRERHKTLCCLPSPTPWASPYLVSWPEPPSLHTAVGASELRQLASRGGFLIENKRYFTVISIK